MRPLLSRRLLGTATAVVAATALALLGAAPAWAAPPSNDDFANAQTQTGSFTDNLNTTDATTETGEPLNPSCVASPQFVNHTVWYGVTVSAGTEVSVDTAGSNFDTVLTVYTGPSLGSLTETACNDDAGGLGGTSALEFTASSSTTYWIQASGYRQFSGDLDLNVVVTPPAAADIDVDLAAHPHLGILVPYLGYTVTAHNTGPDAVTSATLTATLPAGKTATQLSSGCTSSPGTVTCTYGSIANGASATSTFHLPLNILSFGHVTVTATRTASTPNDNNPANDSDTATCTVLSIILATCP